MLEAGTPLMRQYQAIKMRYPHALLLFRLGDFYELFHEDAIVAARELQMRRIRGAHHSSVLSEISSQFHDECSAAPGRFFIETLASSGVVRMNFAFAP